MISRRTFIAKSRRALFGEDFNLYYELLKNRLIFLDGNKDDFYFLEHYVLLGNYARDPDRFEAMDELFQQFLGEAGVNIPKEASTSQVSESFKSLTSGVDVLKREISVLEEERDNLGKRLQNGGGLFNKFLNNSPDPMQTRAAMTGIESRLKELHQKLAEFAPQLDSAQQQVDFVSKDHQGRLGDYLNEPENAKRLFDPSSAANETERATRGTLTDSVDAAIGRSRGHAAHSGELRNSADSR